MTDPERDDLLRRLAEAERARRRWKVPALVGTPVLSVLLLMVAAFGTSSYLLLRDAIKREQAANTGLVFVDVFGHAQTVELDVLAEEPAKMPREPEP
jgi:hypothetical protein